jgi:hypothetical protein
VVIGIFGLGMAGLLMLNTTLQNQAFEARALNRQATELAYVQADLERQLEERAAPGRLALAASQLGMRPQPPSRVPGAAEGRVVGEPKPVNGSEQKVLVVKTPEQIAAEQKAAEAKAKARPRSRPRRSGPPPSGRRRRRRPPRRRSSSGRKPPRRRARADGAGTPSAYLWTPIGEVARGIDRRPWGGPPSSTAAVSGCCGTGRAPVRRLPVDDRRCRGPGLGAAASAAGAG